MAKLLDILTGVKPSKEPKHRSAEIEMGDDNHLEASDEFSRNALFGLSAPIKAKERPVNGKIKGYEIKVSGQVRNDKKPETYNCTVKIPHCPDKEIQFHIKRFVKAELIKAGTYHNGLITTYIDEIKEIDLPLTFWGKKIFDLSRDEVNLAADYFNLRGVSGSDSPSVRESQKTLYIAYCIKMIPDLKNDERQQGIFITKMDSVVDYKQLPELTIGEAIEQDAEPDAE